MYEHVTYKTILNRMLEKIPSYLDTKEGSLITTTLAPIAMEIYLAYFELDKIINECYADTQSRDFLIKRAKEHGVMPKLASPSVWKVTSNCTMPLGTRFAGGGFSFYISKRLGNNLFEMTCEQNGQASNLYNGEIIPLDYVDELSEISITELIVAGEDDEDTEIFRKRYFDFLESASFGGNVADYKEKALEIDGVGSVKVVPNWDGAGTVKLIFTSAQNTAPSQSLVDEMQEIFDPSEEGSGNGLAPIGHVCTVVSAKTNAVNLALTVDTSVSNSVELIEKALEEYLNSLREKWGSCGNLIVRINQIEAKILEIDGIDEVSATKINGTASNLTLAFDTIPVRGTVNATIA